MIATNHSTITGRRLDRLAPAALSCDVMTLSMALKGLYGAEGRRGLIGVTAVSGIAGGFLR